MSEKEKMLNGEMYYAPDEELSEERIKVKEMTYDYNLLRPSKKKKKKF